MENTFYFSRVGSPPQDEVSEHAEKQKIMEVLNALLEKLEKMILAVLRTTIATEAESAPVANHERASDLDMHTPEELPLPTRFVRRQRNITSRIDVLDDQAAPMHADRLKMRSEEEPARGGDAGSS